MNEAATDRIGGSLTNPLPLGNPGDRGQGKQPEGRQDDRRQQLLDRRRLPVGEISPKHTTDSISQARSAILRTLIARPAAVA
jgi:hypothetical protein